MMILGAVKAGCKAGARPDKSTACLQKTLSWLLLVSPRNTAADHISLFDATGSRVLLTPPAPHSLTVKGILKVRPLQVLDSPRLDQLLTTDYAHYHFRNIFAEARNEPLVVVRTSGTTAVPETNCLFPGFRRQLYPMEPIRTTSGFRNPGLALSVEPLLRHAAILPRECSRNCFPHAFRTTTLSSIEHSTYDNGQAGNQFATLFDPIANQTTVITPLTAVMPSARSVVDGLKHVKADALILAPPFLEQIAKSPDMVVFIASNIEAVTYAGGDVSQWPGYAPASKIKLFNFNGSTGTGSLPMLRPSGKYPSEDWKYIHPHPAAGIEFRPSLHGRFEAFIVKNTVSENEQPVFKLFPHLQEYPTKDLWAPHLSKRIFGHTVAGQTTLFFLSKATCAIQSPWNSMYRNTRRYERC